MRDDHGTAVTRAGEPSGPGVAAAERRRSWLPIAAFVVTAALQLAMLATGPPNAGLAILAVAAGASLVVAGLANPTVAVALLLVSAFFRLALPSGALPVEPFLLAFAGVLAAASVAVARRVNQLPRLGAVEGAMVLYLAWNIGSALAPHRLPATVPNTGEDFPVWRFILSGVLIPFVLYVVARFVFVRASAVRQILWVVLGLAAYSVAVSVLQFHAPALVWPRYIVSDPNWEGRAVGVFNQPVVNGLILIIGLAIALYIAGRASERRWLRVVAGAIAATSVYAVYLTYTRAIWLGLVLVLVAGSVLARGFRIGFVLPLIGGILAVGVNWSTFASSDRDAGGIASTNEVDDRLNMAATAIRAIQEKPIAGWGIGRFTQVNTYQHEQWSPTVAWERGYGLAAHHNELGIAAELGLVGLVLWLAVVVLVLRRLVLAVRTLPQDDLCGRGLAVIALACFGCWLAIGATVDLRFFELPNGLVMLLAGLVVGATERAQAIERPDGKPGMTQAAAEARYLTNRQARTATARRAYQPTHDQR